MPIYFGYANNNGGCGYHFAMTLTILLKERGGALSFVGFWHPSMPSLPDATILNYLNDRDGGSGRNYLL